jgi:phosphoribosylanthranilate isomerase
MNQAAHTRVKICGITTLDDARMAIEAGAEMLGFNFYPRSVRYISPEAAHEIVHRVRGEVECVGVFVNEPKPSDVIRTMGLVGLAAAQLHGDESPNYYAEVNCACSAIKALRVDEKFRPQTALLYGARVLLDAATPQYGGSGKTIDWKLAAQVRGRVREVILAGGLHPGNVAEAVAVVRPDAVDACSGLECEPGRKDPDKLKAFIAAVREADGWRKAKVLSA